MFSKTIILISLNKSNYNLKHKYMYNEIHNIYMIAPKLTHTRLMQKAIEFSIYTVYIQNNWYPGVIKEQGKVKGKSYQLIHIDLLYWPIVGYIQYKLINTPPF